jgi:hypothetical protein
VQELLQTLTVPIPNEHTERLIGKAREHNLYIQSGSMLGERIVVAPVDVTALRHERQSRIGHHMLAHLRTEAYEVYRSPVYPPRTALDQPLSYEENVRRIEAARLAGRSGGGP